MSHTITEAKKSCNQLAANWKTRKAGGVIQSKSKGPRTRSSDFQGQEKIDVSKLANRENVYFLCFFVLFRFSTG